MRSCFAVLVLAAGLIFPVQHLAAQFDLNQSRIGVGLHDIDADRAAALRLNSVTGVEVVTVDPGSPAEQAGIRTGDVLLSYNGESIMGAQQLGRLVSETPVGRKVKIEYSRDGRMATVTATTAARQPNAITFNGGISSANEPWVMSMPVPSPRFSWMNMQLGIECEGLDARNSQLAEYFGVKRGVLVRSVNKDSAAAKAGLRAGDVITQIAGHPVGEPKEIMFYIRQERAKPFPMDLVRDHKTSVVKVTLPQEGQE